MKLTIQDLTLVREHAIARFLEMPLTGRLPGMKRDLDENEKRALAFFDASIVCLNRLGLINQLALETLDLRVIQQTLLHDVIDEGMEAATFRTK